MTDNHAIELYIGCTQAQKLIADVFAWSVKRRTQSEVNFHYLYEHAVDFDMPGKPENRPGTPFSFHRFMIPQIANYTGRAGYMDCDQIVFKDMARLFNADFGDDPVLCCDTRRKRRPQPSKRSSMMILDCSRLDWDINNIVRELDAGQYTYSELFSLEHYRHKLSRRWNMLDQYIPGYTALLHLTSKRRQPWINHTHKLGRLWMTELFSAIDHDFIKRADMDSAVDAGLVRPSLGYQTDHRILDPRRLPEAVKNSDQSFIEACAAQNFNNTPGEYRELESGSSGDRLA